MEKNHPVNLKIDLEELKPESVDVFEFSISVCLKFFMKSNVQANQFRTYYFDLKIIYE